MIGELFRLDFLNLVFVVDVGSWEFPECKCMMDVLIGMDSEQGYDWILNMIVSTMKIDVL